MARILIVEKHTEHEELFALMVERLGHEPVRHDPRAQGGLLDVDLVLLEPDAGRALPLARALRDRRPSLPIVCVSIYPQTPEVRALEPIAYLLKPFDFAALAQAITTALEAQRPPVRVGRA